MRLTFGAAEVCDVSDGFIRLDGGAMFGVIPRALWQRAVSPDDAGRVRLAVRPMLVQVDDRIIVVDTGMGTKWSADERARYGVDQGETDLVRSLEARGVAPENVTDVVLTHLHFDHAGGTTRDTPGGTLQLTFPNARHHLQRRNLAHARRPTARDRGSYLGRDFALLGDASQLVLHDGRAEIAAGVDVLPAEGHTVGLQMVRVRDPAPGGAWLLFPADVIPTRHHLGSAWVMAYDLMPDVSAREKAQIVRRVVDEEGTLFFEHDPDIVACTVIRDARGKPTAERTFT